MKICINSIGFTEERCIKTAEGLIGGGCILAGAGVLAATVGLLLIRSSQEWYVGTTNEQIDVIARVWKALDAMKNTD